MSRFGVQVRPIPVDSQQMPPRTFASQWSGEEPFDFDAWKALAERDPPAFFRERARLIAVFIAANPDSAESLRVLQGRIDRLRAVSVNPRITLDALIEMIAERLLRLTREVDGLGHQIDGRDPQSPRAGAAS